MGKWENKKEKLLRYWIVNLKGNFLIFNIFISWDRNRISSFGKETPAELAKHKSELLCLFGFCFCLAKTLFRCVKGGFRASLLGQCLQKHYPQGHEVRRGEPWARKSDQFSRATLSSFFCGHCHRIWIDWGIHYCPMLHTLSDLALFNLYSIWVS